MEWETSRNSEESGEAPTEFNSYAVHAMCSRRYASAGNMGELMSEATDEEQRKAFFSARDSTDQPYISVNTYVCVCRQM